MARLWFYLRLIILLVPIGFLVDQKVRYGIWWEWEDFLHHETIIGVFVFASLLLFLVSVIDRIGYRHKR